MAIITFHCLSWCTCIWLISCPTIWLIKIIQIYQDKDGNKMDRHTYLFSPSVCFSLQLLVSTSWNCCLWIHSSFSYSPIAYKSYSHLVSVSYILIGIVIIWSTQSYLCLFTKAVCYSRSIHLTPWAHSLFDLSDCNLFTDILTRDLYSSSYAVSLQMDRKT
jgi:hypothetical protein